MKVCSKCHKEKDLNDFTKQKLGKYGVRSQCKNCEQQYRKNNVEHIKDYNQRWNKNHAKAYRELNKEKRKQHHDEWYKDNKAHKAKYKQRRCKTDLNYRIACLLRTRLYDAVRNDRSGSAVKDLGCSIEDFKGYISNFFVGGMTWDNYGEWHLDHIKPLSKFDLTDRIQFKEACHYTNYQPLWAKDNLVKGAR